MEITGKAILSTNHLLDPVDLGQTDGLPAWLKPLSTSTAPIHGIARRAGFVLLRSLQVLNPSHVEVLLKNNVVSAITVAKALRPKDVYAKTRLLLQMSSVTRMVGEAGRTLHCANRSAFHGPTTSLALELAKDGIRVHRVATVAVATEMGMEGATALGTERTQDVFQHYPLGTGKPEEVTHAIAYLMAETGRWITGPPQTVDGGYTTR